MITLAISQGIHWQKNNDAMDAISPLKPATEGQIGKTAELLTAVLRKNNKGISSKSLQKVLEMNGGQLAHELFSVVRKYVDAQDNIIVRVVKVNRNRSAEEALRATSRESYFDDDVVASAPKGKAEEVELILFHVGGYISNNDLEKEYKLRGLELADLHSVAALNESDPAFADEHPNGIHWKDKNGKWCFIIFSVWCDKRTVFVDSNNEDSCDWWFVGVRKK